jgi:hypothetical protein
VTVGVFNGGGEGYSAPVLSGKQMGVYRFVVVSDVKHLEYFKETTTDAGFFTWSMSTPGNVHKLTQQLGSLACSKVTRPGRRGVSFLPSCGRATLFSGDSMKNGLIRPISYGLCQSVADFGNVGR